ncbi:MAG: YcfL family protein [Planctomycetota bacterium]
MNPNLVRPLGWLAAGLFVLLMVMTLTGCQTVNTAARAEPTAKPVFVEDRRVTTDSSLKSAAGVVRINEAVAGDGFLKVQAEVLNATSTRKRVHYQFEWFDADGMRVGSSMSNWKAIALAGKESRFIQAVAPLKSATDFRLKLQEPES